ncbi:MAG: HAD family hydrolase [Tissierellales bacterium]
MLDTFLFDLDGTLLPLDMEKFLTKYFSQLCIKFESIFEPRTLQNAIWASTNYMISNTDKEKMNKDCFFEDFQSRIDHNIEDLYPIFDEFYKKDFVNIKEVAEPNPIVREIIKVLKAKNYNLIIATNPLFPKEAIYQRIDWAGLNVDDFMLVTSYENMHFCKPNIQFYKEILDKINKTPENTMMVGNDAQEDIISSTLGMNTFLIEDYLVDRGLPVYIPDYRGSMEDFYKFVRELPCI